PVLRGIDLTVSPGEVVAVLGPNGSGKSTLVRTAIGLVPVTRGTVSLFGRPVPDFHEWSRVGYVPQRPTAASGVPASVREVVSAGRLSRRTPFRPLDRQGRVAVIEAITAVGLADRTNDKVSALSGGQQQRVLIARALAGDPELYLLDEPLAGVDLESQQAIADSLRMLVERGATVVVVLHELGPFRSMIERTVVLRDGRLAYDGAPLAMAQGDHGHHYPTAGHVPDSIPQIRAPLEDR
ncbi:MAG: metal ABC transporter ATP-binding protein, partial [Nocardioidaceae bacterium]